MAREFAGGANTDVITKTPSGFVDSSSVRTISCWFWIDSTDATSRRIWQISDSDDTNYIDTFFITSSNAQYQVGWTTTVGVWTMDVPSTGSWHNLCITYNGGATGNDPVIYLDNSSQSLSEAATPDGNLISANSTYYIGNKTGGARCLDGKIAEIARWNTILTAGEIATLSKGYSPLFFPIYLLSYMPLIGRNSPETDIVFGNTGTVTGAVAAIHPRIIYPSLAQIRKFTTAVPPVTSVKDIIMSGIIPFAR